MGLSRTVSEINGEFSHCKIFPPPCILRPTDGVSLGIGYRRTESKTRMIGLPEGPESFKITVETQYRRVTDRRTDGRTPHDGEDRAMQNVARKKTATTYSIGLR